MSKFFYLKCLMVFFTIGTASFRAMAQLPVCDRVYMDEYDLLAVLLAMPQTSTDIYNYDPAFPVSATNPSVNTIQINAAHSGLTVSTVLGSNNPTRTFYTTIAGKYWYYDPVTLAWVNTGHTTGHVNAVNIGAGGGYIYNLRGATGEIFRYDGTGNGTLLVTIGDMIGEAPWDLIADCDGNFYVFNATANNNPAFLRKYNPNGVMVQEWAVINPNAYSPAGGFAIVGNSFYADHLPLIQSPSVASGVIVGNDLQLNAASANLPQYGLLSAIADLGSCDAAIPIIASIEIAASDTSMCKTRKVDFWVTTFENQGATPTYQWFVNGVAIAGATDTVYSYSPQQGDVVTCQMVSSKLCVVNTTVSSNPITMIVEDAMQPILTYDPNEFCTDVITAVLPTVNTVGGTFMATGGLAINTATGEITPSLSSPGEYVVTYTNPPPVLCPLYSATAIINVYSPADASIEAAKAKLPVCLGDTVILKATEARGNIYIWEPKERIIGSVDESTAIVKRDKSGSIMLTVYAKGGCMDSDSITIDAGISCCKVFMPTAFSPNNDGTNDYMEIQASDIQAITGLKVFDRYGQVVFETGNIKDSWDGMKDGKPCEMGVYYYQLIYSCDDGKTIQKKGDITLIR